MFFYLENEGLLDPLNETDLYCLHKVFLAKINQSLEEFKRQYNNHPIRTEGNQTPLQLFCTGMLLNVNSTSMQNLLLSNGFTPNDYGIEEEGPVPTEEASCVLVPPPRLPNSLTLQQENAISRIINDTNFEDFGISRYLRVLELVNSYV